MRNVARSLLLLKKITCRRNEKKRETQSFSKTSFKYNEMHFRHVTEDLDKFNDMKKEGHHVVHTNRRLTTDDALALKGIKDFCQINSDKVYTHENMLLKSHNIPCSCTICRQCDGSTCPCLSIRNETAHHVKKEEEHATKSNEKLKT